MLTDIVSFKVAKELDKLNLWYYETINENYLAEDSFIKCDDVKVAVKKGDLISNEETINLDHPKLIKAPTYAEAIDALSIAGLKINIAYNKGFMYFKGELAGTGNKDMAIAPEHLEDQWLEDGIINACDLLKHYQNINCE